MDCRAKRGSTLHAEQSTDCANPCFAPNIYTPSSSDSSSTSVTKTDTPISMYVHVLHTTCSSMHCMHDVTLPIKQVQGELLCVV